MIFNPLSFGGSEMQNAFGVVVSRDNKNFFFSIVAASARFAIGKVFKEKGEELGLPEDWDCEKEASDAHLGFLWKPVRVKGLQNVWQRSLLDTHERLYVVVAVKMRTNTSRFAGRKQLYSGIGYYGSGYEYGQVEAGDEYEAVREYIRAVDFRGLGSKRRTPEELAEIADNLRDNKKLRRLADGAWALRVRADHRLFKFTLLLTKR